MRVVGDDQVSADLRAMAKRGEDPRPVFKQLLEELRHREPEWFESHGGGHWPDLAEATRTAKAAAGLPPDPLVRSGALKRSLTVRRGSQSIRSATKRGMHFGTKIWYARVHQRSKRETLPRRDPLVKLGKRERRHIVGDLTLYMLGRAKGLSSW